MQILCKISNIKDGSKIRFEDQENFEKENSNKPNGTKQQRQIFSHCTVCATIHTKLKAILVTSWHDAFQISVNFLCHVDVMI